MPIFLKLCLTIALCTVSYSLCGVTEKVSIEEYARMIGEIDPARHKIKTRNDYGSAYCFNNELTDRFLAFCRAHQPQTRVLEIGAAYGIKSSQIVQTGVRLTALDLEESHLELARSAFAKLGEVHSDFCHCEFICGDFLSIDLKEFSHEAFDAILIESVFHFISPEDVQNAVEKLNGFLKPGGRVYLIVSSPFCRYFIDAYDAQKAAGWLWPGFFLDPGKLSPVLERLRKPYHAYDLETLEREFKKGGFSICEGNYTPTPHREFDIALDGREGVFLVAEKKRELLQ